MLCTHPSIFGFPRNYECVYLLRASTKTSDNHLGQDLENTLSEEGLPIPAFFSLSMQHGAERAAESLFDGLFSIKSTLELLFVTFGVSLGFKSSLFSPYPRYQIPDSQHDLVMVIPFWCGGWPGSTHDFLSLDL